MSDHPRLRQPSSNRLFGALFIAGSVVGLIGNALHPHTADLDVAATAQAIASNGAWVAIHLAIIVAILLVVGGFVGLTEHLSATPGRALARLGLSAALIGGAVVTVSIAVDGFSMKAPSVAAAGPAGPDAAVALQVAVAVTSVDFGIWSIGMLAFFGVAFGCYGAAVVASRRYPAWFGWIAVVAAVGSGIAALLRIGAGVEAQSSETLFLVSSLTLTLWALAIGVLLWRGSPDPVVAMRSSASSELDLQA